MFRLKAVILLMFVLVTSSQAYENRSMRGQKPTDCDVNLDCVRPEPVQTNADKPEPVKLSSVAESIPQDFSRVIDYVDPNAVAFGYFPKKDQELALDAMTPFQKVEGGYLIEVSNLYGMIPGAIAYLQTNHEYDKGTILNQKQCKVVGMYNYIGLDGFKKSVYHLKEIKGDNQ